MNTLLTSSGRIYLAPWGTDIPTGLDTPNVDWTDVGLISEDGFHPVTTPTFHPRRHWNSLAPNWQFPAGVEETVVFTPLEYSEFVNVFEQGGGVWTEGDDGIRRFDPPDRTETVAWSLICDATDETRTVRTVLERCIVTSPIDRTYNATTMTTTEVTLALCSTPGTQPWWQYDNGDT